MPSLMLGLQLLDINRDLVVFGLGQCDAVARRHELLVYVAVARARFSGDWYPESDRILGAIAFGVEARNLEPRESVAFAQSSVKNERMAKARGSARTKLDKIWFAGTDAWLKIATALVGLVS